MYNDKGLIKVFNGEKFKTVSYRQKNGLITFTTSNKSNKYKYFISTKNIKIMENGGEKTYNVTLIENESQVDKIFSELKKDKIIPFFIPRKHKIIVQYQVN
jgi:hypothetical protein